MDLITSKKQLCIRIIHELPNDSRLQEIRKYLKNLKNWGDKAYFPVSPPEINPWKERSHTKADTKVFCSCPIFLDFFDFSLEKSRKCKSVKIIFNIKTQKSPKNVQDYITLDLVAGVYFVHFTCLQLQTHVSYFKIK